MAYPTIQERTKYPVTCKRCHRTVLRPHKHRQFCSTNCAFAVKPLGEYKRYNLDIDKVFEALVEANGLHQKRTDKIQHAIKTLACSYQTLCNYMKRIGYTWSLAYIRRPVPSTLYALRGSGCAICGDNRLSELSHIISAQDGGPAHLDNLIPLCPSHHVFYDRGFLNQQESEDLEYEFSRRFSYKATGT